jgi:hypothetical protein
LVARVKEIRRLVTQDVGAGNLKKIPAGLQRCIAEHQYQD